MIWKVKLFEKNMSMNFTSPFDTSKMNFVIPIHLLSKSGPNSSKIPLCTSSNRRNQTFSKSSSNDYTKTMSSASFRKKNSAQLEGDLWTTPKGHPIPHVHSEKSKQNTPLHHKCSSPGAEPLFVWLWLAADANLLWEKSTADWLLAGSWCWFGVREKHCLLIGWQAKWTAVWTYILCGHK